jgi:hypothetical protein
LYFAALLLWGKINPMADLVEGNETLLRLTLISESDRTARDLTGGSANLIWSIDGGSATSSSMTLEDAANGIVTYRFTSSQLTPGRLRADVESTDSAGNTVRATDILSLLIRRKVT